MKRVFKEVESLDKKCYEQYGLSEDLLMEHASLGLYHAIPKLSKDILIVSGSGNNGADGIALARLLQEEKDVKLYLPLGSKSPMSKVQLTRAKAVGVEIVEMITDSDVIVDCLFGSGLKRELSEDIVTIINKLNSMDGYKLSCDIPTGIDEFGSIGSIAFKADTTVTMGALKESLYLDCVKDYVGEIVVANLGVARELYEDESQTYLLDESDLKLPTRELQDTNKGRFGHLGVIAGKKPGAAILCAKAGFAFGSGLVTVVENENYQIPYEIMNSSTLPENITAICLGMGLGNMYDREYLLSFLSLEKKPVVVDADMFYREMLARVLEYKKELVLTPHPKEFCSLLKLTGIADIEVSELQKRRFHYVREFCDKYSDVVLVLKGANTLIAQGKELYIQPLGSSTLSKGGSGDVLAGLIGSLLAQGNSPLKSAINGSLAHALSLKNFSKNSYALTPEDLIEGVSCL